MTSITYEAAALHLDARLDLRHLPVAQLTIARYQRPADERRWQAMARVFDIRLVGSLVVSYREGRYFVVTGQHRMLAARQAGVEQLPCVILHGLTYEQEAALFERNATSTQAVPQVDLHRARVEAREPDSLEIERIIRSYGHVGFARGGAHRLTAVATCKRLYRRGGGQLLNAVLFATTAWRLEDGDYIEGAVRGGVLRALGDFLEHWPQADLERLRRALTKHSPAELTYSHNIGNPQQWRVIRSWYNAADRTGQLREA